jgi:hypothetical protein
MSTDVGLATKKCQLTLKLEETKTLFLANRHTRLLVVQVDLSAHFSGASISYPPLASGSAKRTITLN